MKLQQVLTIGGNATDMVSRKVQLDLRSPGRAVFEIVTDSEPTGLVELHIGYKDKLVPYFLGVIESKIKANNSWFLTCRELIGALAFNCHLSLRHPTLNEVLAALNRCGVECFAPDAEYSKRKIPAFYHVGDGLTALRQIGKAFNIADYIFQQRANGKIYVGSWHDSGWQEDKKQMAVPEHVFTSHNAVNAKLLAVPQLRPGIKINDKYVSQTTLTATEQEIIWSPQLSNA